MNRASPHRVLVDGYVSDWHMPRIERSTVPFPSLGGHILKRKKKMKETPDKTGTPKEEGRAGPSGNWVSRLLVRLYCLHLIGLDSVHFLYIYQIY